MKKTGSLLLLLIVMASCNQPKKTDVQEHDTNASNITPAKQPVAHVIAGDPTFVESKDTVSKYGPHSITRNVLQDKNGTMWFATWQGIIRYDGKLFTNVTLKEGLAHFHVFSLLEDRIGNLWFGMIGGGVYRYDGHAFTYFTTTDGLAGNTVMCMLEDRAGNIWFGTKDNGVSCFNGSTFITFTTKDGLVDNSVYSMVEDNSGKLWFGTEAGVSSYYHSASLSARGKFLTEKDLPFTHVLAMIKDKNGKLWIGSQVGLSCYDPGKSVASITKNFTPNIFEDRSGKLWLSGSELNIPKMGLYLYDGTAITRIRSDTQVFGVTQDRDGNIWFGTANGVCHYNPSSSSNSYLHRTGCEYFSTFARDSC